MDRFVIAQVLPGKLNALVKNIMRQTGATNPNEAVRLVNSGEWVLAKSAPKRREEDGVIYFTVTSDGTTGEEWITRLESNGVRVSDYAKQLLRSSDFKPTNGVTTKVVVLKGMLFGADERTTENIRAKADKRKFTRLSAEAACLIREKFTDKELEAMGLTWIVAMHEPINGSDGRPGLLYVRRRDDGRWLDAYYDDPGRTWHRDDGFAFAVPQAA